MTCYVNMHKERQLLKGHRSVWLTKILHKSLCSAFCRISFFQRAELVVFETLRSGQACFWNSANLLCAYMFLLILILQRINYFSLTSNQSFGGSVGVSVGGSVGWWVGGWVGGWVRRLVGRWVG